MVNESGLAGAADRDREQLEQLLRRLGATPDEIANAVAAGAGGGLALDLVVRAAPPVTVDEAAAQAGIDVDEFLRYWHALGFASPPAGAAVIPAGVAATLPIVAHATREWIGDDSATGIARVVGSTGAQLAESLVDAFRVGFEVPELTAGTSYSQVVEEYVDITRASLPGFVDFLAAIVKAHLVRVASGAWSPDDDNAAARRDRFVGFVDLVGYTALSRTLSPSELARLLASFENAVDAAVAGQGGRLVKLIGDGAMFVAESVDAGCEVALQLSRELSGSESLPPARVGADCGPVLSRYGDYFGEVVNRAARLVALANPATVVVSDTVARTAGATFAFEQLPAQALKGFQAPAVSYRLRPA